MNYTVSKRGKEYAIFCATSKCYVLFGKKKEMEKRCKELNTPKTALDRHVDDIALMDDAQG